MCLQPVSGLVISQYSVVFTIGEKIMKRIICAMSSKLRLIHLEGKTIPDHCKHHVLYTHTPTGICHSQSTYMPVCRIKTETREPKGNPGEHR